MEARKSSITPMGVKLRYIKNFETLETEGKLIPSTKAMQWCMMACGVNRIFSQQDLMEFLFRLPLALHSLNLIDNWFAYDQLMNYKSGGSHHSFSVNEIFTHYGIEVTDSVDHYISRDSFFEKMEFRLKDVMIAGIFIGIEVIPLEHDALTDTNIIRVKDMKNIFSEKLIQDADFFADDIMKLAPYQLFNDQARFNDKLAEIAYRRKQTADLPRFDLNAIPLELRHTCMNLMFKKEWIEDVRQNAPKDYEDLSQQYIFLAWLFANDLMINDGRMAHAAEGVDLNPEDYAEEEGMNLLVTYENYNMEAVVPLLKALFF